MGNLSDTRARHGCPTPRYKSKRKAFTRYAQKYVDGAKSIEAELEQLKKNCAVIRVLAHTQVTKTGAGQKKAHLAEIQVRRLCCVQRRPCPPAAVWWTPCPAALRMCWVSGLPAAVHACVLRQAHASSSPPACLEQPHASQRPVVLPRMRRQPRHRAHARVPPCARR